MSKTAAPSPERIKKTTLSAIKLYQKQRLKEARKKASLLLSSNWSDPNTFFQVGIAAHNAADLATAKVLLQKVLTFNLSDLTLKSNTITALGNSCSEGGELSEAINHFDEALKISPKNAGILNNRAIAHLKVGDLQKALEDYQAAHKLNMGDANISLNLGDLLIRCGKAEEALNLYLMCISLHPQNPEFQYKTARLKEQDFPLEALSHFRAAVTLDPNNHKYLSGYSEIFTHLPQVRTFDGLENELLLLLSNEDISWANLNKIVPQHIKVQPAFNQVLPNIIHSLKTNSDLQLDYGKTIAALSNNVLLSALTRMRLIDPAIEKLLECFRRQTLAAIISGTKLEKPLFDLLKTILVKLAYYCFLTEYVFVENDFERDALEKIISEFEHNHTSEAEADIFLLKYLILSCYRPVYKLPVAKHLIQSSVLNNDPEVSKLLHMHIKEPLTEQLSYSSIPEITPIKDTVSQAVREQYEESPYPRWQHLHNSGTSTYADQLANSLPILKNRKPSFPASIKVLIAGCGTGRQPISTARSFPETDVLAVDLSLASIAYAKRKTEELKVNNITFRHGDIMELGNIDQKFDVIECAGVLHHMKDPVAGWQVLCDLLKDDGYMLIGLYSEIGRQDVVASRDYIKRNNYSDNLDDMRQCRKAIMALDDADPIKFITYHSDFYTTSACRDLIFHVQEYRFTIPEIEIALDKLGMEFCGFITDKNRVTAQYMEDYPEDTDRISLKNWHRFEEKNTNTFATMYKFWIRKKR